MGARDMTSQADSHRCVVCGRYPLDAVRVSLRGEATCFNHPVVGICGFCAHPLTVHPPPSGWSEAGRGRLRCPTCAAGAIETVADVKTHLGGIRQTTAELGFSLPHRVRVDLDDDIARYQDAARHGGPGLLGITEVRYTGAQMGTVAGIRVQRGMPSLIFGKVVAHELGHAWLAQRGLRPVDGVTEEGVCELIAYAWLKRNGTLFAQHLRTQMLANTDPVYGVGFRAVHEASRVHGIRAVISALATSGRLPSGHSNELPDDGAL